MSTRHTPGNLENDANAILISAAPDLLQALQTIHAICVGMDADNQQEPPTEQHYKSTMAQAAAAISKATEAP